MSCDIVLGGQWGDEGKAKIIDYLAGNYDIVSRFQGGANAGHTVEHAGKKYVFHLIPSGILYPETICVLGNGIVLDIEAIISEIENLKKNNINVEGRLKISSRAFLVFPFHREIDKAREKMRTNKIGTTGRGIGPAYSDKINRIGIRVGDLEYPEYLKNLLTESIKEKKVLFKEFYKQEFEFDVDIIIENILKDYAQIKQFVENTPYFLNNKISKGKSILFEGAQGTGLDIDFGSYPFVTSSSCSSGGATIGTGVSFKNIGEVIGVYKSYITRVGEGALPTKCVGEDMERLRTVGKEFGATTGRPRDCGWFDGVQAKYSIMVNGVTGIALTKLDIFDEYDKIYFCTDYEIDGKITREYPMSIVDMDKVKPVYKEFKGWNCNTRGITDRGQLPKEAIEYLDFYENYLGTRIKYISTGPDRTETIKVF